MRLLSRPDLRQRVLSGVLILFGLYNWAVIIGAASVGSANFVDLNGAWQFAIINLAVAYLVAAVGLWLIAAWGLVIWIYAAGCEIAMHTVFAATFGLNLMVLSVQLALFFAYITAWLATGPEVDPLSVAGRTIRRVAPMRRAFAESQLAVGMRQKLAIASAPNQRPADGTAGGVADAPR